MKVIHLEDASYNVSEIEFFRRVTKSVPKLEIVWEVGFRSGHVMLLSDVYGEEVYSVYKDAVEAGE